MQTVPSKPYLRTRALVAVLSGLAALTAGVQTRAAVAPTTAERATTLGSSVSGEESALAAIDRQRGGLLTADPDLDLVHSASGAIFPGSIAAFERRDARELAADERRLSITYTTRAPGR